MCSNKGPYIVQIWGSISQPFPIRLAYTLPKMEKTLLHRDTLVSGMDFDVAHFGKFALPFPPRTIPFMIS
jgi:hypothetical protein